MLRRPATATVEVDMEEFEARARSVSKVDDLSAFFASGNFAGFARARNAEGREVIVETSTRLLLILSLHTFSSSSFLVTGDHP